MIRSKAAVLAVALSALAPSTTSAQAITGGGAPAPGAGAPSLAREVAELRSDLGSILRSAGWAAHDHALLVVSLDHGDTLVSINPDLPLVPASNMKIFSTAAALYYLGPAFRYSTYLLTDGEVRDGVLHGDVVLYGTGDPSISDRLLGDARVVLEDFADALTELGIREITGAVVGDGSYFDAEWVGPEWEADDLMKSYAAPVGALSFAENMVSLQVLPGRAGDPARIRTRPATSGLAVRNEVVTVTSGATSVRFEHGPDEIVVRGRIRTSHGGVVRRLPVVDPANYTAAAFRAILEERGIRAGATRSVPSPGAAAGAAPWDGPVRPRVVAVHRSPPLERLARTTNHVSHNMFAEALLKTVGRIAHDDGSAAGGANAVERFLITETGAASDDLRVVDGSGLSRGNRITARATIQLLDYLAGSELADAYLASLPAAAEAGGLRRMYDTPAAGKLRAKTGTIRHVSALSGYVDGARGERLAFSIIVNGVPATWRAKQVEDRIGARLADFARPVLELTPR